MYKKVTFGAEIKGKSDRSGHRERWLGPKMKSKPAQMRVSAFYLYFHQRSSARLIKYEE
jgi:hypothetical protein